MYKVVIYGLGQRFQERKDELYINYDIIALSDKNIERYHIIENYVAPEDIKKLEYDFVLVTPASYREICVDLTQQYDIPGDKIMLLNDYLMTPGSSLAGSGYSEEEEDIYINQIIFALGLDYEDIHYIDVGIENPVFCDNTYSLYRRGATGLLVEADPNPISFIKAMRPSDKVINKAVYEKSGEKKDFYICRDIPALSSLDSSHADAWGEAKESEREKITVETICMNDLFESLGEDCDVLSIDIEGYDYKALQSIDFERYRPKIIIVEMLDSIRCRSDNEKILNLMKENNYIFFTKTRPNGIFIDSEYEDSLHGLYGTKLQK